MDEFCNCEHYSHFDDTEFGRVRTNHVYLDAVGVTPAPYVGNVCTECAESHLKSMIGECI